MRSLTPSVSSQGPRDSKGRFEDGGTIAGWSQMQHQLGGRHCEEVERQGWQEKTSLTCFEVVSPAFLLHVANGQTMVGGHCM